MTDRLDAMQAFAAVCDTGGFAAAARRLDLSPSVVTRLVAGLEERLGVRLLQRTTRSVHLTDAGERFLERARRILADMDDAEASAQAERAEPRGRLTVAAPLLFGRLHVAPLLSRYLERYPQMSGDLQLADRMINLVEDGVDVAIRVGQLDDSTLIACRLGRTRRVLVASPSYLAAEGTPQHPADLAAHRLIGFGALMPGREWRFTALDGSAIGVPVAPRFVTNSGEAAIGHACAGGGITAALCYQVDAALRDGTLVEVLRPFGPPPVPVQAVFPSSRLLSGKVRAFLSLAEETARGWQFGS